MQQEKQIIQAEITEKMNQLTKLKKMVKGTVNKVYTKCRNQNCKCTKGEKHPAFQLTYKAENNLTKTVYLNKNKVDLALKRIENYKLARKLFNEIIELNVNLLKIERG